MRKAKRHPERDRGLGGHWDVKRDKKARGPLILLLSFKFN